MKLKKHDIVLVSFPFSNLKTSKIRPALVVKPLEGDNLILCQITTKKRGISKYEVILNKPFDKKDLDKLKDMYIENRRVDIRNIKIISEKKLIITIHEGRKHIIKKVFRKLGYFVSKLIRVRINNLRLNIPAGNWRFLNNREIIALTSPKSSD